MTRPRDVRRCALQALYQFDATGAGASDGVRDSLAGSPGDETVHQEGFELAAEAWGRREDADRAVAELAPQWPTHRQPVVDRSILRLAYAEMVSGRTPPKVAINEAVELAKEFSTARSPMFINGVLDKLFRTLRERDELPSVAGDGDAAPVEQTEEPTS
ncbi:MAG: transcription antitermination factor NusB [Planctomycetota bacterium]|jgi:N utilization substance protein B